MNKQFYQVGGSLPANAKSYIKREADDKLYNYLKEGKYCYVLNARQVGKSSLCVHTSNRLKEEGYSCVNIDLTSIGSEDITADEWYFSFILNIIEELGLDEDEFSDWWDENDKLTVVNRFSKTFDKFVLKDTDKKIVIFIDEVDSILGIKQGFSADDFFAVIRTFYNLRSEDTRYSSVSFALFGVATPEDLMRDSTRTPFNIAHSIKINQFKLDESLLLIEGLDNQVIDGQEILEKIFEWTDGTPYLTQKILDYIVHSPIEHIQDIDKIVDILFIQENFKEINISNIQKRIVSSEEYSVKMLYLISELINERKIKADDGKLEQIYLKLSGLLKEENAVLIYTNKVYEKIFNQAWLNESIGKIDRPLSQDLQRWLELDKSNSALLKGKVLEEVNLWASKRDDLMGEESEFLRLSMIQNQKDISEKEKKKAQSKKIQYLTFFSFLLILFTFGLGYLYLDGEEQKKIAIEQERLVSEQIKIVEEQKIKFEEQKIKFKEQELKFEKQETLIESTLFSETLQDSEKVYMMAIDRYSLLSKDNPTKYKPKVGKALQSLALLYNIQNQFDKSIEYYTKSLVTYNELNSTQYLKNKAKIFTSLGDIYMEINEHLRAKEFYTKALISSRELEEKESEARVLNNLAVLHKVINRNTESILLFEKSLKIYNQLVEEKGDSYIPFVSQLYRSLADMYIKKGEKKRAKIYYFKALSVLQKAKDTKYTDEISKLTLEIELNALDNQKEELQEQIKNKYRRKGWVYLGEYYDKKWIKKNFKFDSSILPINLINTYQVSKSKMNIRKEAYWGDIIGGVNIGKKVKIIKIQDIGPYKWAYINY